MTALTNPTVPVLGSAEEAVQAVRKLHDSIASRAEQAEQLRSVPAESIRELQEAGLFGIVTPKVYGGSELGFAAMLQAQAELASACASTGWVYGVLAGHSWLGALFEKQAQEEMFSDPHSLIASLIRLGGEAPVKVDGGFRWSGGTGRFCSGVDHSNWVLVGGQVPVEEGTEAWYFLIPAEDIEIVDDWHTAGLRGTGSKSIVVKDAFIPTHRAVRFSDLGAGTTPGSRIHTGGLYQLPFDSVWPYSLAGAAVGAARGALEQFTRATSRRLGAAPPLVQASNGTALQRLAKAGAQIDAAMELLLKNCREADAATEDTVFDNLTKARRHRDLSWSVQQCRDAVNTLYEASGGSGIYSSEPMQRWWRDVNAAAEHVAFTWDVTSAAYGRAAAGLEDGALKTGPGFGNAKKP